MTKANSRPSTADRTTRLRESPPTAEAISAAWNAAWSAARSRVETAPPGWTTVGDLMRLWGISRQATHQRVVRMEQKGRIERQIVQLNGRSTVVCRLKNP